LNLSVRVTIVSAATVIPKILWPQPSMQCYHNPDILFFWVCDKQVVLTVSLPLICIYTSVCWCAVTCQQAYPEPKVPGVTHYT